MKRMRQTWAPAARTLGAGSVILILTVLAAWRAWSDPPALSIVRSGTNEVTLTVTNAVPNGTYEIWWTEFLDDAALSGLDDCAWEPIPPITNGQTAFVLDCGYLSSGFFRAINTLDLDNDGVPNYQDARPFDASVGILRVTIESPANGANVQ